MSVDASPRASLDGGQLRQLGAAMPEISTQCPCFAPLQGPGPAQIPSFTKGDWPFYLSRPRQVAGLLREFAREFQKWSEPGRQMPDGGFATRLHTERAQGKKEQPSVATREISVGYWEELSHTGGFSPGRDALDRQCRLHPWTFLKAGEMDSPASPAQSPHGSGWIGRRGNLGPRGLRTEEIPMTQERTGWGCSCQETPRTPVGFLVERRRT